ncbi:MAG: alpha/beta hydrolase [Candidatus Pacebacteria bacterium]|nr:alpha/beta hydrolase [Candidatus Paceibacterota bacterium]
MEANKIKLKTRDGFEIAADFYSLVNTDAPAVILTHMMPATKDSWKDFARKLNMSGFHCLAIDLRGHGESQEGPSGFKNYNDQQHQASIMDIEAAAEFLVNAGMPLKKIALGGASIGANLSLQFQSEQNEIKASFLLSPGLDYRGVATERLAKKLNEDQAVFLAAGGENDEYSTETAAKLFSLVKTENKKLKILKNAGHGTDMFKEDLSLAEEIGDWLKGIYFAA